MVIAWKKGRGRLGVLQPLIGVWLAEVTAPDGATGGTCRRSFARVLGGAYIELHATWLLGPRGYEETALIGPGDDKTLAFWSFTSDGKHSQGTQTDVTDVHPAAVGFQAQMPAGLARMVYWPDENEGFRWAVESRTKTGWNRFTEHHYRPA